MDRRTVSGQDAANARWLTGCPPVSAPARRFALQGGEPPLLRMHCVIGSKRRSLPATPLRGPNELFPDCSFKQVVVYWQIYKQCRDNPWGVGAKPESNTKVPKRVEQHGENKDDK